MFKGEISDQIVDRFFEERIYQENILNIHRVEDDNGDCSDSIKNGEKKGWKLSVFYWLRSKFENKNVTDWVIDSVTTSRIGRSRE